MRAGAVRSGLARRPVACPADGFVATDMGNQFGARKPVEDGAAGIVWLATLPDDGPTGGFFRDAKPLAF